MSVERAGVPVAGCGGLWRAASPCVSLFPPFPSASPTLLQDVAKVAPSCAMPYHRFSDLLLAPFVPGTRQPLENEDGLTQTGVHRLLRHVPEPHKLLLVFLLAIRIEIINSQLPPTAVWALLRGVPFFDLLNLDGTCALDKGAADGPATDSPRGEEVWVSPPFPRPVPDMCVFLRLFGAFVLEAIRFQPLLFGGVRGMSTCPKGADFKDVWGWPA